MMFLYWGIYTESAPKHVTSCQHASLLTRTSPCSSQVSFSIGQITAILHFHRRSRRCLCVKLVVNQFMHGPIPHILIHESQVKYSQKHTFVLVLIFIADHSMAMAGPYLVTRYTGRYSPAPDPAWCRPRHESLFPYLQTRQIAPHFPNGQE